MILVWTALFLVCTTGEAVGAHACPHHGHAAVPGAADHGSLPGHVHPDAAEPDGGDAAPGEHTGPCTCAGPCHGTEAQFSTTASSPHTVEAFPVRHRRGYVVARHPRLTLLPFFHPYANAPPPGV
ncbi:MAG: hypothetical protein ACOC9N_02700 [Gemmatimonadota bacterium]